MNIFNSATKLLISYENNRECVRDGCPVSRALSLMTAILLMLVMFGVIGCSKADKPAGTRQYFINSAGEWSSVNDSIIDSPNSAIQILLNCKSAADVGWPIRNDFYSNELLLHLTGGTYIRINSDMGEKVSAFIGGFKNIAPPTESVNQKAYDGLEVRAYRYRNKLGQLTGEISIDFVRDGPSFSIIQDTFGAGWKSYIAPLPQHPPRYAPSSASHGNENIAYEDDFKKFSRVIVFYFSPTAVLSRADIIITEK